VDNVVRGEAFCKRKCASWTDGLALPRVLRGIGGNVKASLYEQALS